jgi:hypothetical protein
LIIGNHAGPTDQSQGEAFVVFGKGNGFASNWDVATLDGSDGFRLVGEQRDAYEKQYFGVSVSDAGDINADGYDDLIVGTSVRGSNRSDDTGYSYVLFGRPGGYSDTRSRRHDCQRSVRCCVRCRYVHVDQCHHWKRCRLGYRSRNDSVWASFQY